jgi:hypothetical protein
MGAMARCLLLCGFLLLACAAAQAQVIEFESNGLKYQTLTRSGVTVMYAVMPNHLHDYGIIQVAVANGSRGSYVIKPEDFTFLRTDGVALHASPARAVVDMLSQKGSASDVIHLITSYENAVYGNSRLKSTNGYEQRRQSALAMGSNKLRAMAAASALALVQTKLAAGESTDGAVFFPNDGKPLGPGHIVVRTNTDVFDFTPDIP